MECDASHRVIANRFRLGVTAGIIAVCLIAVLTLLFINRTVSLDENPAQGHSGKHEKSRHAMTLPAGESGTVPSPDKPALERSSAGREIPNATHPVQSPADGVTHSAKTTPASPGGAAATSPGMGSAYGTGVIVGKILVKGTPPAETRITVSDPRCGTLGVDGTPTTTFYRIAPDGGLADVFIHITGGLPEVVYQPPAAPLLIDQLNCWFSPYVSGAQTGQTILVRNSDKTLHNVHWTPTAAGNRESNRAQLPGGADQSYSFPSEETFVRLKCDVHPWMIAYVGVVRHPFFAVTDAKGEFAIRDLPEGEFTLNVTHRKTHPTGRGLAIQVKVEADKTTPVVLTIDLDNPQQALPGNVAGRN